MTFGKKEKGPRYRSTRSLALAVCLIRSFVQEVHASWPSLAHNAQVASEFCGDDEPTGLADKDSDGQGGVEPKLRFAVAKRQSIND